MTNRIVLEFQQIPEEKDFALFVALAAKFNAAVLEIPDVFKSRNRKNGLPNDEFDFPGIEKTPGVCGGDARVAGTRIPVWSLVTWKNLGMTDEKLLFEFETLSPEGLKNAWAFYEANKTEIDAQVVENEHI